MHEVLVNRLGGLSLPRKSVVRLTDRPDMTLDVYRGRTTTKQKKKKKKKTSFLTVFQSDQDNVEGDYERLCAIAPSLWLERFPPQAGLKPRITTAAGKHSLLSYWGSCR